MAKRFRISVLKYWIWSFTVNKNSLRLELNQNGPNMATRQEITNVEETPTFWNFDEKFEFLVPMHSSRHVDQHCLLPRRVSTASSPEIAKGSAVFFFFLLSSTHGSPSSLFVFFSFFFLSSFSFPFPHFLSFFLFFSLFFPSSFSFLFPPDCLVCFK